MLTQKCKYAIRAVLHLSVESKNGDKLSGKAVAKGIKTPEAFTIKILQELAKKKIISSDKGPRGGFYLSEHNKNLPLIDIIAAIDDLSYFDSCGLGLSECSEDHPCPVHDTFKVVRDRLLNLFESKTIGELSEEIVENELFLVR